MPRRRAIDDVGYLLQVEAGRLRARCRTVSPGTVATPGTAAVID